MLPRCSGCLLAMSLLTLGCGGPAPFELEVVPNHFQLSPGERIHYQVLAPSADGGRRSLDYALSFENSQVVRRLGKANVIEAVAPGRTDIVLRTPTAERRITLTVSGLPQASMTAVPYRDVRHLTAKEFLFVGHANRDGFDHTAVAKPGVDRLVSDAKQNGIAVVYWVSEEYPNWYTADRQPTYAIASEG